MATNFLEHFTAGLFLGFLSISVCNNPLIVEGCTYFNFLLFYMSYLIGSIQPDLDTCLSFDKWPKVKKTWVGLIILWVSLKINDLLKGVIFSFFIINLFLLIMVVGQKRNLFALFGVDSNGGHRGSIFHSSLFWGFLNFLFILLIKENISVFICELYFWTFGVLNHLFVDQFGSFFNSRGSNYKLIGLLFMNIINFKFIF